MNCRLCKLESCQCCICLCNGKCVNCVGKLIASAIAHLEYAMKEMKEGCKTDIVKAGEVDTYLSARYVSQWRVILALECLEDSKKDLITLTTKLPQNKK